MDRFDLGDKEILPVTIFGQNIDLEMPTMADVVKMQSAIEKAKGDKTQASFVAVKDLIVGMQMPEDIVKKMQVAHFEKLIDHVINRKKK
jgi:hypothetical protein